MAVRARVALAVVCALASSSVVAHDIYLMNNNHTDYNWNATAAQYDLSMAAEIDYYLGQIQATAGAPSWEQARFNADNWWYLWLYEHNRTPAQFEELLDAIRSGHITVPLNPFVTLYGAMPTEAVIRAGYYPGRMMRRYGIEFLLAESMESHTTPWGLSSLWAGSGVQYTWKGICGCVAQAPNRTDDEVFFWEGPDGQQLLFKWYEFMGWRDWGGYAEAADNLGNPALLDDAIALSQARMPGLSATGLFGAGEDLVSWQSTAVVDSVVAYNATVTGDRAIVSNGIDFFRALEDSGETVLLNVLRGGWGNDWDMWPASLAAQTAAQRRALERLRLAEALAVLAQREDKTFWPPRREALELGLLGTWKFFEHGWNRTTGGPSLGQIYLDKRGWTEDIADAVEGVVADASAAIASRVDTPDEDRMLVFNPLGFPRTEPVDVSVPGPGPWTVLDLDSGLEVPSQVLDDGTTLRFLALSVPSLGYRIFRLVPAAPTALPDAGIVDTAARTITGMRYRVALGDRGQIVSVLDLAEDPDLELAGASGLNDFLAGTFVGAAAEDVGPVSATLRIDVANPSRTVRVTLFRGVDRVVIQDDIVQNVSGLQRYRFHAGLAGAAIHFEEVGAIARPGRTADGGDFLQGTRADRMVLNHFVDFAAPGYHLTVANDGAYAMQVNDSTPAAFDLTGDTIDVIVMEQPPGAGFSSQGGDTFFRNRFALAGFPGPFDAAEAMRAALADQNPLHPIPLPRNQAGPLAAAMESLASVDDPEVVVTALKPAEDTLRGYVLRAWNLGEADVAFQADVSALAPTEAWRTSLIETDAELAVLGGGVLSGSIAAGGLRAWRIDPAVALPLQMQHDIGTGGVRILWSSGEAPYVVRRSPAAAPDGGWIDLTPEGGTAAVEWVDPDPGPPGTLRFYRVEDRH